MQTDHAALTILDRKIKRIGLKSEVPDYRQMEWLEEIPPLIQWILSVRMLNAYVRHILEMHDAQEQALAEAARAALVSFRSMASALRAETGDDSAHFHKAFTWSAFDGRAEMVAETEELAELRDGTQRLANILIKHAERLAQHAPARVARSGAKRGKRTANGLLAEEVVTAAEIHLHRLEVWQHTERASPRTALIRLLELCRSINAPVHDVPHWTDLIPRRDVWPEVAPYRLKKYVDRYFRAARADLARVVEELHVLGASTLSHRVAVERFKERSVWYDKARLRAVAGDNRRGNGTREDRLTLELAKYLHDAGILVFARPRIGSLEPDLVGVQGLAVEAKAYERSARADIVSTTARG